MSSLHNLNAANQKNIRLLDSKVRSNRSQHEVYPNNKVYLEQSSSAIKEFNREKTIEQNKKLKKQLVELYRHMNEIISKSNQRKKYGINLEQTLYSGSEVSRLEIKKQEIRIIELKNESFSIKKEI